VNELVERSLQLCAHRAFFWRAQIKAYHLKSRAVMQFERAKGDMRHDMIPQIGRDVGDSYLVMLVTFATPDRIMRRIGLLRILHAALVLIRRRPAKIEKSKTG